MTERIQDVQLPTERVHEWNPEGELPRDGVLFVQAGWSAPARLAWQILCAEIGATSIPVYVFRTELLTPALMKRLGGGPFGGWGETFWLRDGRVVAATWGVRPGQGGRAALQERIRANNELLLGPPGADP